LFGYLLINTDYKPFVWVVDAEASTQSLPLQ
jgi:hypothetical protein